MKTAFELSDAVWIAGTRVRFAWDALVALENSPVRAGERKFNDAQCEYALARSARDHAEHEMLMGLAMRRHAASKPATEG